MTPLPIPSGPRPTRATVLAAACLALAGCASFTPDGGMDRVNALVRERAAPAALAQRDEQAAHDAAARAAVLLREPLTADAAVQVALLANRHLQASLAELGVAEAARVRLGRLPNPSISLGRLAGGGDVEVDRGVAFDLLALVLMPVRESAGARRFEIAQLRAADDILRVAADARRRWVEAVAAARAATYAHQALDAADAASDLATRLAAAGNVSDLSRLRARAFHADAQSRAARADAQAAVARERLVRALGLADGGALKLPDALPDAPSSIRDASALEQAAIDRRLDVRVAAREAEAAARDAGLVRTTRFVDVLELGMQDRRETGRATMRGADVRFELPLFDGGGANVAQAEAGYRQAMHRAAAVANDARSEVRQSYAARRAAWELARHYRDEVVPLRRLIVDETLRRYNGMLVDVFELLADAREHVDAVAASDEALRDFWLADIELGVALDGRATATPATPAMNPIPNDGRADGAAPPEPTR